MKAAVDDRVELLVDVPSDFSDVVIPKGTPGSVMEVYDTPREGYAVDVAIPDGSLVGGFRYDNVILRPEQFRVLAESAINSRVDEMPDVRGGAINESPEAPRLWLFPREYQLGATRWQSRAIYDLERSIHPLLNAFGHETVKDLPGSDDSVEDAKPSNSLYRSFHIQHEWKISPDEILNFDISAYLNQLYDAANNIGGQLIARMFEHISAICTERDQVVNIDERNFYDVLIESTERMELEFDQEGNLTTALAMHPDTYAKLAAQPPPTPEQEERMRAVVNQKREEWRASRRRRTLP